MGNRSNNSKIYSVPSFFTVGQIREIYCKSNNDMQALIESITPIKANFTLRYDLRLLINTGDHMKINRFSLSHILKTSSGFDNIAFLQFNLSDQKTLFKNIIIII